MVTMGNVADRIGRRRLLLLGTLGFGAARVTAAFAPSAGTLIAARALLGIGGATIMPSTLSLIRNIFPNANHRATAIAIWSAGSSGGTALGPLVGGVFLRRQRTLATPLIDVDLFKRPAFTWAIIATVLAIFSLAGLLYFFSQHLQLVRGYSTLQAGLTELPTSLASIAVVVVVASVVRRLGNGRAL